MKKIIALYSVRTMFVQHEESAMPRKSSYPWHFTCMIALLPIVTAGCEAKRVSRSISSPAAEVCKEYEKIEGKTWAEWSIVWWQRVLALPREKSPLYDTTGQFTMEGQKGNIWFLYDTIEGSAKRKCTIPTGKYLFFPVINAFMTSEEDKINAVRLSLIEIVNNAGIRIVKLDGQLIVVKQDYRLTTPPFRFKLPGNSANTLFPDLDSNQVGLAEGYWLMLKPLSPGKHSLQITGKLEIDERKIETHVDYELTVEEAKPN